VGCLTGQDAVPVEGEVYSQEVRMKGLVLNLFCFGCFLAPSTIWEDRAWNALKLKLVLHFGS